LILDKWYQLCYDVGSVSAVGSAVTDIQAILRLADRR
jgi:hypothetical protein